MDSKHIKVTCSVRIKEQRNSSEAMTLVVARVGCGTEWDLGTQPSTGSRSPRQDLRNTAVAMGSAPRFYQHYTLDVTTVGAMPDTRMGSAWHWTLSNTCLLLTVRMHVSALPCALASVQGCPWKPGSGTFHLCSGNGLGSHRESSKVGWLL